LQHRLSPAAIATRQADFAADDFEQPDRFRAGAEQRFTACQLSLDGGSTNSC
jgi:hypothetical protein